MHALKHCQEHANPTGGNIISTVKPCWPIRSLKKFPVGGDTVTAHAPTSQAKISGFVIYTITLQPEFLKIFTLAGVFKKVRFSDLVLRLRVDEWPNCIEKPAVLKIPAFVWTGP